MSEAYISTRCKKILYMVISTADYIPLQQISDELKLSKRSVYYELCKINDWMSAHGFDEIEVIRGKGIHLSAEQKNQIESAIDTGDKAANYVFSPMERIYFIICFIIRSEQAVSVNQLAEYLQVSRNTIFNDLRVVVKQLQDYDLSLEYVSKKGYLIKGDSIRIRALFILYFAMLRPIYESGAMIYTDRDKEEDYLERLEKIGVRLKTSYVDGTLLALAVLMPVLVRDNSNLYFPNLRLEELKKQKEFKLVEEYFPELEDKEKIYICLHLLGSRITAKTVEVFDSDSVQSNYELSKALISEFEKVACVAFENKEELEKALFHHLNTSMYRFQYGIQVGNPMLEDVVREYPNLFELTKRVCFYLEQQIGLSISDGEVAYLALHFGSHLQQQERKTEKVRVLIICSNGVSAGNMIRHELNIMIPDAEIVGVVSAKEAVNVQNVCDIVISTVKMNCLVPVITVHPILTDFDRKIILNHSLFRKKTGEVDVPSLYEKIRRFVPKEAREEMQQVLYEFFAENSREVIPQRDKRKKGLIDYLKTDQISMETNCLTWEKALRLAGKPLIEKGSVKPHYISSIVDQTRYYGPYMFITKEVVLAHARPEEGVLKLDVSMTVFREPIRFSDYHEASIIIVMAAEDQEKHLKILKDIMTIFSKDGNIQILKALDSSEEVYETLGKMVFVKDDKESK